MKNAPFFSIVIPVYNGGEQFRQCLAAISQSIFADWELIVVDDGSTDGSTGLAAQVGATVLHTQGRLGPAAARNLGASAARGPYLYFIDADCQLHPDTLVRIARYFEADPELEALFGSYDDAPAAANAVAQYKNLFHHYVHQTSHDSAATFWTGCGAIKRTEFLKLGGFDVQRYRRPSVEDIDLGYRLKRAGGRIRLAKDVQIKHLKVWTLPSLLKSDIFDRGIPWTELMLRNKVFLGDLNLQTHNRVSVVVLYGLLLSVLTGLVRQQALLVSLMLAVLLVWLNVRLYTFFYQKRGLFFLIRVIPLHWLYYFYNALSFVAGLGLYWQTQLKTESVPPPKPFVDGIEPE